MCGKDEWDADCQLLFRILPFWIIGGWEIDLLLLFTFEAREI